MRKKVLTIADAEEMIAWGRENQRDEPKVLPGEVFGKCVIVIGADGSVSALREKLNLTEIRRRFFTPEDDLAVRSVNAALAEYLPMEVFHEPAYKLVYAPRKQASANPTSRGILGLEIAGNAVICVDYTPE